MFIIQINLTYTFNIYLNSIINQIISYWLMGYKVSSLTNARNYVLANAVALLLAYFVHNSNLDKLLFSNNRNVLLQSRLKIEE